MDFLLGIGARGIKTFVSTPNLRIIVPLLHLLVAFDNCCTPYKFGFRKPKCWGPRDENQYRGISAVEVELRRNWIFTSATPTFRFSK